MKKTLLFIGIIGLSIGMYFFISYLSLPLLDMDEAKVVGEEVYLEFLWMVDGAFNDGRYQDELKVNDKKLLDEKKIFKCNYNLKDKNICEGENFEEEFENIFYHSVTFEDVYSDAASYSWYKLSGEKHLFKNSNSCENNRISNNQKLEIVYIKRGEVEYKISFDERKKDSNKVKKFIKAFTIKYEKGKWKVAQAYYHDPCSMDFYINVK